MMGNIKSDTGFSAKPQSYLYGVPAELLMCLPLSFSPISQAIL
jgi:hypothetical protein